MGFGFWVLGLGFSVLLCAFVVARFCLCLLIHFYLFWFSDIFGFSLLFGNCVSIVNSHVDEFVYVLSFLGFNLSYLPCIFSGFCLCLLVFFCILPVILLRFWFHDVVWELCFNSRFDEFVCHFWFCNLCIFSAWIRVYLVFQLMDFPSDCIVNPLLYLFAIVVMKLYRLIVRITSCFSCKEGRWLPLSQPCLQLVPSLRLAAVQWIKSFYRLLISWLLALPFLHLHSQEDRA